MKINDGELYYITDSKDRLYLTGFFSTEGYVMITTNESYLVVDERYYSAALTRLAKTNYTVLLGRNNDCLVEKLKEHSIHTLGVNYKKTTVSEFELLKSLNVELCDISSEIEKSSEIKTQSELNAIKKACKTAEKSFALTVDYLKQGVTEIDIAAELEYQFKKNGATNPSFDTIVAFGKNSAVPHHETDKTVLKYNTPVLIDFGCVVDGYCSDITRTLYFGTPDDKFVDIYEKVLKAKRNAQKGITVGMTGREADEIARNTLREFKLDKYFTHSLGHGIGVNIHETPYLSKRCETKLDINNVFSIEPGVYFNGKFGIRIEDTVTLTESGIKRLSTLSDKLMIID